MACRHAIMVCKNLWRLAAHRALVPRILLAIRSCRRAPCTEKDTSSSCVHVEKRAAKSLQTRVMQIEAAPAAASDAFARRKDQALPWLPRPATSLSCSDRLTGCADLHCSVRHGGGVGHVDLARVDAHHHSLQRRDPCPLLMCPASPSLPTPMDMDDKPAGTFLAAQINITPKTLKP